MRKTVISILLVSLMILESTMAVFASSNDKIETIANDVNFKLLYNIGMLPEEMKTLGVDHELTRKQFAYICANMLGYDSKNVGEITISDAGDDEYTPYINFLAGRNIIKPELGNKFRPDDKITYIEMLEYSLYALGYEDYLKVRSKGIILKSEISKVAKEIKITKGLRLNQNDSVRLTDAMTLMKNVGLASVMKYVPGVYSNTKGETLFYTYSGIAYVEGVITENGISSLTGPKNNQSACINGITVGTGKFPAVDELLGEYVEACYLYDYGELLYAGVVEEKNNIIRIDATELNTSDRNFSIINIKYGSKKLRTDANTDFIYNDVAYPACSTTDLAIKQGYIKAIDNDNDRVYEVVKIYSYEDYVVLGSTEEYLYLEGRKIDIDDYDSYSIYSDGERRSNLSTLITDRVVSLLESKSGNYIKIIESSRTVTGAIASMELEDGRYEISVLGEKLYLSDTYVTLVNNGTAGYELPGLGRTYVMKVNFDNRVIAMSQQFNDYWQMAYCVGVRKWDETVDGLNTVAKLVMMDGSVLMPYFANKVFVNNTRYKHEQLMEDPDARAFFFDASGYPKRQPVRIKLSDAGEISSIETPVDRTNSPYGYDKKVFSLDAYFEEGVYRGGTHHGVGMYTLDAKDGIIVEDPWLDMTETKYSTEDVEIKKASDVGDGRMAHCYVYDADATYTSDIVVYRDQKENLENVTRIMLIDKVGRYVNEDLEILKKIKGYINESNEMVEYTEEKLGILPESIKAGDLLRINVSGNILVSYEKLASFADDPAPFVSGTVMNEKWGNIFGYLYAISEDAATIIAPEGYTETPQKLIGTSLKGGGNHILIYDRSTKRARVGTWKDLITSELPDSDGDITIRSDTTKLYIYRRYDYANGMAAIIG